MHEFARMPLGEMLRFWSQCSVAYILVDINNKTIAKMVKVEGERSVDPMMGKHLKNIRLKLLYDNCVICRNHVRI